MSKALQILKACRERGQKRAGGIDLDEAITELEDIIKPKSCDGCRYNTDNKPHCFKFNDCIREITRELKQDRYEPNDNHVESN